MNEFLYTLPKLHLRLDAYGNLFLWSGKAFGWKHVGGTGWPLPQAGTPVMTSEEIETLAAAAYDRSIAPAYGLKWAQLAEGVKRNYLDFTQELLKQQTEDIEHLRRALQDIIDNEDIPTKRTSAAHLVSIAERALKGHSA